MKNQSRADGQIYDGNDPTHPNVVRRNEILESALGTFNWNVAIQQQAIPNSQFVKFTANIDKSGKSFVLEIYIFPNLADSGRSRPNEKRIQLTRPYDEHKDDFLLNKQGMRRCLLLGIYDLGGGDVVICAWDAAAYQEHASPISCYVDIGAIAEAFRSGFALSEDNKGRYVCCFRPEFIHYYIENMSELHVLHRAAAVAIPAVAAAGEDEAEDADAMEGGENVIYYGAPGTGKTHTVDGIVDGSVCIRTVFHPDVQNSDFVGALKPVMQDDKVTYSFSPGPFALALSEALTRPKEKVYLILEELNRAPAAAVFGDLFLLLDRQSNGAGKFDVDFPNSEFRDWLHNAIGKPIQRIVLPKNMWILATMNSADQGVYPLDTAFRRRWQQIYVPINYETAPEGTFNLVKADGKVGKIAWSDFAKALNDHLTHKLSIAEDRLLGPWFVTPDDLAKTDTLPGKVLIYLWDDLLRHHGREHVFDLGIVGTYGKLSKLAGENSRIFADGLLASLEPLIKEEGL